MVAQSTLVIKQKQLKCRIATDFRYFNKDSSFVPSIIYVIVPFYPFQISMSVGATPMVVLISVQIQLDPIHVVAELGLYLLLTNTLVKVMLLTSTCKLLSLSY